MTPALSATAPTPLTDRPGGSPSDPSAPAPDELAGCLRTEVSRLAYHLRSSAAESGVTSTQLAALAALARHPDGCRAGDLAAEMGVTAASMTRLIDILVTSGWAVRTRDEADARATLLSVTPLGADFLQDLRRDGTSQLAADLADLDDDDRAVLARAVPILRAISDRHLSHPTPRT